MQYERILNAMNRELRRLPSEGEYARGAMDAAAKGPLT